MIDIGVVDAEIRSLQGLSHYEEALQERHERKQWRRAELQGAVRAVMLELTDPDTGSYEYQRNLRLQAELGARKVVRDVIKFGLMIFALYWLGKDIALSAAFGAMLAWEFLRSDLGQLIGGITMFGSLGLLILGVIWGQRTRSRERAANFHPAKELSPGR